MSPSPERPYTPVIHQFLEGTKELAEMTGLSRDAIGFVRWGLPRIFPDYEKIEETHPQFPFGTIMGRAEKEIGDEYRHLYRQATISLWSLYEVHLNRFLVAWVSDVGVAAFAPEGRLSKLAVTIPIDQFMTWWDSKDRSDFAEVVVAEVKRNLGSPSGTNPGAFERVLAALGLQPPKDSNRRRTLRQLWSLRNLFVHRGDRADVRFLTQYPGDDIQLGSLVRVGPADFLRFHTAVIDDIAHIGDEADRVWKLVVADPERRPPWHEKG